MRLAIEVGVFAALARRLYGDNWKGPAGHALGVRRDTLNKIMRGKLSLQPGLLLKMQMLYEEMSNGNDAGPRRAERVPEGGESPHRPSDGGRE